MRRRYKNGTGIGIIAFVVLILCGIVTYRKIDLDVQGAKAESRIVELKAQIVDQEDREQEIKDYKAYVQTKRYIKDVARDKLGLVDKDDVIFEAKDKKDK